MNAHRSFNLNFDYLIKNVLFVTLNDALKIIWETLVLKHRICTDNSQRIFQYFNLSQAVNNNYTLTLSTKLLTNEDKNILIRLF